jgi:hypothetical protein
MAVMPGANPGPDFIHQPGRVTCFTEPKSGTGDVF